MGRSGASEEAQTSLLARCLTAPGWLRDRKRHNCFLPFWMCFTLTENQFTICLRCACKDFNVICYHSDLDTQTKVIVTRIIFLQTSAAEKIFTNSIRIGKIMRTLLNWGFTNVTFPLKPYFLIYVYFGCLRLSFLSWQADTSYHGQGSGCSRLILYKTFAEIFKRCYL